MLAVVALFGAGCAKQVPSGQIALPSAQNNVQAPIVTPAPVPSPTPAPASEPEVVQVKCPVTTEIVRKECGLPDSTTLTVKNGYYGSLCGFETRPHSPILVIRIAASEEFGKTTEGPGAPVGANIHQVVEAVRKGSNIAMGAGANAIGMPFYSCERWETREVSGVGDEALLTPIEGVVCEKNNSTLHIDSTIGAALYFRKGAKIAQVTGLKNALSSKPEGCSPEAVTKIAKDYVVPAM